MKMIDVDRLVKENMTLEPSLKLPWANADNFQDNIISQKQNSNYKIHFAIASFSNTVAVR